MSAVRSSGLERKRRMIPRIAARGDGGRGLSSGSRGRGDDRRHRCLGVPQVGPGLPGGMGGIFRRTGI